MVSYQNFLIYIKIVFNAKMPVMTSVLPGVRSGKPGGGLLRSQSLIDTHTTLTRVMNTTLSLVKSEEYSLIQLSKSGPVAIYHNA